MTKKIMIVDDSKTVRLQVLRILEKNGYEAFVASDGQEALTALLAQSQEIAMVISDVNMPRMDGLELARQMRAQPDLSRIPILMLTSENDRELLEEASEIGVSGWLHKPVAEPSLAAAVNKLAVGG